eukprot:6260287-Amphidinium_carterae.1
MRHWSRQPSTSWMRGVPAPSRCSLDGVKWARQEHERWLEMSPEKQAGMEWTFVLGSINPVPQAPDTITAYMQVDVLEAVPKFLSARMTRTGTHQVHTILFYNVPHVDIDAINGV